MSLIDCTCMFFSLGREEGLFSVKIPYFPVNMWARKFDAIETGHKLYVVNVRDRSRSTSTWQ